MLSKTVAHTPIQLFPVCQKWRWNKSRSISSDCPKTPASAINVHLQDTDVQQLLVITGRYQKSVSSSPSHAVSRNILPQQTFIFYVSVFSPLYLYFLVLFSVLLTFFLPLLHYVTPQWGKGVAVYVINKWGTGENMNVLVGVTVL